MARWWLQDREDPHSHIDKPGGISGEQDRPATQGSSAGKETFKTSGCKNLWGLWQWEKLLVSQEGPLEGPTGS